MNEKAIATVDKPVVFESESGKVELTINQVKKFVAHGSKEITINEAITFVQLCKFNKLNPWVGDAYLIKYGNDATMITSKYAYMKRAERAGDSYKGFKAGVILLPNGWEDEFVKKGQAPDPIFREGTLTFGLDLIGGWAEVYIQGRDFPVRAEIDFNEYVGRKSSGEINSMWKNKPGTMIRKCALVGAFREAFPDIFGGLISEEEVPEIPGAKGPTITPQEIDEENVIDLDTGESKKAGPPEENGKKKKRSRRNVTALDGKQIKTCGISGIAIASIQNAENKDEKFRKIIDDFLKAVGANDLTFLREDEGTELMEMISAQMSEETPPEEPKTAPPEQKEETPTETSQEDKKPEVEQPEKPPTEKTEGGEFPDDEKVPCPDRGDIDVEFSFCRDQCPKFDDKSCFHFKE